jgi:hypothetical protein
MTTIAEDLVLLLLDDESGRSVVDAGRRYRAVGGAVLIDLVQRGRITVDVPKDKPHDARPRVRDATATGDPVLDAALAALGAKSMSLNWAVETIGHDCWKPLLDGLAAAGLLRREERGILGSLGGARWKSVGEHESQVVGRIRAAVVDGAEPDGRTAVLVTLLHHVGAVTAVLPGQDKDAVKARAAAIAEGSWAQPAVREALRGVDTALIVLLGAAG